MPINITDAQRRFWQKYAAKNIRGYGSQNINPGEMYLFNYDSKLYEEGRLAYYDKMPLIMLLGIDRKYMLGLSLHYLPRKTRLYFVKKIILKNYKLLQRGLPPRILYSEIKDAANLWYREGMVIIRKYIRSRIKSNLTKIHWTEWINAVSGEGAQWEDITAAQVYLDTKYKLQGLTGRKGRTKPPKRESSIQRQVRQQKERVKKQKERTRSKFVDTKLLQQARKTKEKFKRKKRK